MKQRNIILAGLALAAFFMLNRDQGSEKKAALTSGGSVGGGGGGGGFVAANTGSASGAPSKATTEKPIQDTVGVTYDPSPAMNAGMDTGSEFGSPVVARNFRGQKVLP